MDSFAQRLTLLRENKNLKKKDLAAILNVSSACISQYENESSMPSPDILVRIAQYFNVSVDFLIANDTAELKLDLRDQFCEQVTFYDLLNTCNQLPPKSRKALLSVIDALQEITCKE